MDFWDERIFHTKAQRSDEGTKLSAVPLCLPLCLCVKLLLNCLCRFDFGFVLGLPFIFEHSHD
jgi:hypothetical protein